MLQRGDEPIPGYTLEDFLGKGTFGEVWRAAAPFGVKVALKFIDVSGKAGLKEFRGIQRVKDIRHAHLMPITAIWMLDDYGTVLDEKAVANLEQPVKQDPTATMSLQEFTPQEEQQEASLLVVAMLLADDSLLACMERHLEETGSGIPLDELLDYMEQAARGIDYLNLREHDILGGRATIQHCDIKPENMMLVGDSVMVCDFGLAQLLGDVQRTATGMMGTPAYIAPEVLMTQRPSPTTDQYSLACTYLHLRTGQLPFDATTSLPAVFEIHKTGKLKFANIPGNLERQVVKKAASVDPTKRYASTLEFIRELRLAIAEDKRKSEELVGAKLRRIGKRAAAALILVAMLSGIGYSMTATGRTQLTALAENVQQMFVKQKNNGSQEASPEERAEAFQRDLDVITSFANGRQWQPALKNARRLIERHPEMGDAANAARAELIGTILATSRLELDDGTENSLDGVQTVLADLSEQELDDQGQALVAAGLIHAQALARDAKWREAISVLDDIEGRASQLGADQQQLVQTLRILEACAEDSENFFKDEVLDALLAVGDGLTVAGAEWESQQLAALKISAFDHLEKGRHTDKLNDVRLQSIFPGELQVLELLTRASQALSAESAEIPFESLRRELAEANNQTTGAASKARLEVMQSLIELLDPDVSFSSAVDALPERVTAANAARQIADKLLNRADRAVSVGSVGTATMNRLANFLGGAATLLPATEAREFELRHLGIQIANGLYATDFDVESRLANCERVRSSTVELDPAIHRLVTACWAECRLLKGVDQAIQRQLKESDSQLATVPSSAAAYPYVCYVRARIRSEAGGPSAVRDAVTILDGQLDAPIFPAIASGERAQFLGQLLVKAIEAAHSGGQQQLSEPAFLAADADLVTGWIATASRLGVPAELLQRSAVLANFYRSDPNLTLTARLARELTLAPENRNDGHLLKVRAIASSQSDARDLAEALQHFSELLAWAERFDRSKPLQKHQNIIQPAVDLCLSSEIRNFRDGEQAVNVDAVPTAARSPMARILASSAQLVEDDFETADTLYAGSELGPIEHRYFYFRAAAALEPRETSHLVGQYWALRDWPDRDNQKKVAELFEIAERAYQLAPDDPEANGIMGEAWVARSRRQTNTAERMRNLDRAIELFNRALATADEGRARESFLPLRSSANVEIGYLMGRTTPEKIARLQQALKDAEEASTIRFRRQPATAFLAWGNAAEDMAFYCENQPDLHFRIAIEKFSRAVDEAGLNPRIRPQALMALGRCRFRRAVFLDRERFKPAEPIDLADEIDKTIAELSDAETTAQSNVTKSEVLFWLSSIYDLKRRTQNDASAKAQADQHFLKAIDIAGSLTWAPLSWAWARRAYFDGEYEEAIRRATRLLEERSNEDYVIHWKHLFDALTVIFLSTPPEERFATIEKYSEYLPADDPSALYYRVSWKLLGPNLLSPFDYLSPNYSKDVRLPQQWKPDLDAVDKLANEALELAEANQFEDLAAQAQTFLALSAYTRWVAERSVDPASPILIDASTKLSSAAERLLATDYAGLGEMTVSVFALYHANLFANVCRAASTPEATKSRIRDEENPRIRSFQQHVRDQGLKVALRARMKAIEP